MDELNKNTERCNDENEFCIENIESIFGRDVEIETQSIDGRGQLTRLRGIRVGLRDLLVIL